MSEAFSAPLEHELRGNAPLESQAAARSALFDFVTWYNAERLHSSLGYVSPVQYEQPLVLDNASIHTVKLTRAWLAAQAHVMLRFSPAHAGHRENPVEKVWWCMKQQVTANPAVRRRRAPRRAAVHAFFGTFTLDAALALAA